ncbi:hypothetical protein [Longimicrobium sp.]|uniref:hypothetical protein n=1 Tax=Longimicrobium sp. TaxID=2029185 RepID=UPI003B3BC649
MRIIPLAMVLLSAAGCAAGSRRAVDLPPPCAPDVAARILADSTAAITPPIINTLITLPERARGAPQGAYGVTFAVGVDGAVVPGTVRVTGPDHAGYTRSLVRWAEQLRFVPAIAEGCGIQKEITMTLTL